jgi:hypothetical protein
MKLWNWEHELGSRSFLKVTDMSTKRFQINDLSVDNCFEPLIDRAMRSASEHSKDCDSSDKPLALLSYIRETARFQQKLLKIQLAKVDLLTEPEMHALLSMLSEDILKLEVSSTISVQNYDFIDI